MPSTSVLIDIRMTVVCMHINMALVVDFTGRVGSIVHTYITVL